MLGTSFDGLLRRSPQGDWEFLRPGGIDWESGPNRVARADFSRCAQCTDLVEHRSRTSTWVLDNMAGYGVPKLQG